ncbi:MAG: 4-alpha-glucanotransferase [Turneriella sp.]|nr:4-alpha-glucanotransferase [Turneriella sp.]
MTPGGDPRFSKSSSRPQRWQGAYPEAGFGTAAYATDQSWMKNLVVVAKNVPLWLAQLSAEYQSDIRRLDEIPEAELEFLKSCGVNGIWLVGLWQRSTASARIKRDSGDAAAESSAYAVFSYTVDDAYGGESALAAFRTRAKKLQLRLGCDMVPNHTGIDSAWLNAHPDWFMQTAVKPFPGYTFSRGNLSSAPGNITQVEDGYYRKSDAAVVFRHESAGRVRYIYHGNDGTGLPWNDTAQLNHLLPEVRAALIETALRLAAQFDFIRFDAAMTLLKEHYRRLWFPAGHGPIAGRTGHGISSDEFDRHMPEFWSELVGAFRERSPGTLLLAEAFWLTENYFIRSIGMHRVYNSAFMHFIAEEKNSDFAAFMRDHLRVPETLNRFVNYLSTPDEKPAAEVFPDENKYFGAMKLIATLPGMPLLAPGQLEGFGEKYSMDQLQPKRAEKKRAAFIARHRREISPLLAQRSEFADAHALRWLDVEGSADRVIAYETGITRKFRIFFNNAPLAADFQFAGERFSLAAYECRITEVSSSAATPRHSDAETPDMQTQPAYPSLTRRHAGVTVPVSALRSQQSCGIGEFSDLKILADWCAATGQNFIALLPVSDTGANPSPYSAVSAFALHPVYLRIGEIAGSENFAGELEALRRAATTGKKFRFDAIVAHKLTLLRKIYDADAARLSAQVPADFLAQDWLVDYAVYKNIKTRLGEAPAQVWADYAAKPADIAQLLQNNTKEARAEFFRKNLADTGFYVWLQYHAEQQLKSAVAYARGHGVYIKGDLPILLERDSADVWLNPQLFRTDLKAGAPPDHYSADGQNWGFPVYDWPQHRADGFAWLKSRIRQAEKFFAAYRIDHVLGFFRIWCLDAADNSGYCGFFLPSSALSSAELCDFLSDEEIHRLTNAANRERCLIRNGEIFYPAWDFPRKLAGAALSDDRKTKLAALVEKKTRGDAEMQRRQGHEILSALKTASAMLACAEDLGAVPDYVGPTLAELKILSLCVLRWRPQGDGLESPANYNELSVATPSVHDSSNLREWLATEGRSHYRGEDALEHVLRDIYSAASALALVPLQDLLALDQALHGPPEKERINVPGTVNETNWSYRMPLFLEDLLKRGELNTKIRELCTLRLP